MSTVKIYAKVGESAQQFNGIKPEGWIEMQSERPEGTWIAQADGTWGQMNIHDQAMQLSMSKLDFVEITEALTANMPNPVTWASINNWMQSNPEIQKLFILATDVYRNDPKLEEVTAMFGAEFLPFLDMMFVYKDAIKAEIAQAKAEGRAINLDAYIPSA